MNHPIACVAVFVKHNNCYLIADNRKHNNQPCIPGGKIDWMEAAADAGVREINEETNLRIDNLRFLGFGNDFFPDTNQHFVTLFFESKCFDISRLKELEPDKIGNFRWLEKSELQQIRLFASASELIYKL